MPARARQPPPRNLLHIGGARRGPGSASGAALLEPGGYLRQPGELAGGLGALLGLFLHRLDDHLARFKLSN